MKLRKHVAAIGGLAFLAVIAACLVLSSGRDMRHFTMLHVAVMDGDVAEVERWVTQEDVHARDKHGQTALGLAAQAGRKDIAELLLSHGADANDGALAYAVGNKQRDMVEFLLLKGARPGGDPMVQAAMDGDGDIARLLVAKGADVNAKGVDVIHSEPGVRPYATYGDTPLCIASEYGQVEVVKLLLENKADVNLQGRYGYPLGVAAEMGHMAIVELLLSRGARIDAKDDGGRAAADLADKYGHKDVADAIRRAQNR